MTTQLLDQIPILWFPLVFAIVTFAVYEIGFRVGVWWQERMPGDQEAPTGVLVGSLLGLMAFLLAVTMGLAADRFDARRGLVVAEANAIGKTYLQADYLPDPQAEQMREHLREYLPLRIASTGSAPPYRRISSDRPSCTPRCGPSLPRWPAAATARTWSRRSASR